MCQVLTVACVVYIRRVNELSHDLLLGPAVHVLGHQLVHAVVDVRGVDELQAAVVLALGGDVYHGVDEVVLQERLVVVVPLELRLGVAGHGERDAPVVVEHWLQELQDGRRDWFGGSVGGGTGGKGRDVGLRQGGGTAGRSTPGAKKANIHRLKEAEGWSGRVTQHWRRKRWRNVATEQEGAAQVCRQERHRRKSYTERKHGESIRFAKRQ